MSENRIVSIKDIIGKLDADQFGIAFKTKEACLELLSHAKWADGFICRFCGSSNYCRGKLSFSRRCTRCKKEESPMAHTIFNHCRIELPLAFEIAFLVCNTPTIPASELSNLLETRHMTCLNFKKRILNCLKSDGNLLTQE